MAAQGVTPAQRLEAAARQVMKAHPRSKWTIALLAILSSDNLAMLELMRPLMQSRAKEYLESLAQAGEGEGQLSGAEQATERPPSPEQSPQGGDVGQKRGAEQANADTPASQQPAQADGREGQLGYAEQAIVRSPSRPITIEAHTVTQVVGRDDETGRFTEIKAPFRRAPNPPRVDVATLIKLGERRAKTIFETFMIGHVPLGEATPEMCRSYIKEHRRDALFIERVITGVPDGERIAKHVTPEVAQNEYSAANSETYNV
ncbi:MAG: hypothetical protein PHZ23_14700 [Acidiphilium sp.]|nr:hypothetical protein [Acidiphilium sp.]